MEIESVMSPSVCDATKTEGLDHRDHGIAKRRKHLWSLITVDTGSIFAHDYIPYPVELVFNMPVLTSKSE